MARTLSLDLRVRVLRAVGEGVSHREVGQRFGVSAASVSRWRRLERDNAAVAGRPRGGDRRSGRIEAHAGAILAKLAGQPDATLDELRADLAGDGLVFGDGSLRRFLKRHNITRKKRPRTPLSRTVPTS